MLGVHPVYNPRDIRLTLLASAPNGPVMVDLIWKDDGPGCQARSNPDIPDRFFIYQSPSDPNWSWLRTALFYHVERKATARKILKH